MAYEATATRNDSASLMAREGTSRARKRVSSSALAAERTYLANERTMMAWVRTATSLITFGFTIYKFFQITMEGKLNQGRLIGPRGFGLMMIAMGLISLVLATVQNRRSNRKLRANYPEPRLSLATMLGAMMALLGIMAMIAVLLRA